MAKTHTVRHFVPMIGRWLVEDHLGDLWTTDQETAEKLAEGYRAYGYKAEAIEAEGLALTKMPLSGTLVLVE